MPNLFFPGQTDYIEKLNTLATTESVTDGSLAASFLSLVVAGAATFGAPSTVSVNSASAALTLTQAGAGAALSTNGQIVSTLGTGTAPFSVVSTTVVANLNAALLNGATFAAPGTIGGTTPGAATFTTLTATGQASFAAGSAAAPSVKVGAEQNGLYSSAANTLDVALNGVRQFQFGYTASAVNYLQATGSTTGNETRLRVQGSDTNAGMWLTTKGNGVIRMETGGGEQFRVSHTASAVNYLEATGAATTNGVRLDATGSDSGVNAFMVTKGSGVWNFCTGGSAGNRQLQIGHTASAVNYATTTGSITGLSVMYGVGGSDANVPVAINSKAAANIGLYTNSGSNLALAATHVTNSVNYWAAYPSATGSGPIWYANGSDAAMNANYSLRGTGSHVFYTGSTSAVQLVVAHVASTINWPVVSGSTAGNAVTISTNGTDTNRSITLTAAGTGTVNVSNPLGLKRYTVATLPAATTDRLIIVSDESGGLVPAFSDGTNWRRVTDRAIVS